MYSERFFRPPDLSSDLRQVREEERKHEPITQPTQISSPSVFFDETPPVVAQGSLTAVRKKPNLFADLEDDDDDGFGDATPATIVNPRGYKTQVNLFDDEPPEMEERVSGATAKSRGLFDDNVDGDLAKAHSTVPGKKPINLFDDDAIEDDLFAPKRVKNPETVAPKSATLDDKKNPVLKSSQNDTFKQSMEEMLRRGIGGGNKLNTSRPTSINNDFVEEEVTTKPREVIKQAAVGVKKQLPKLDKISDNYNPVQPPKDQPKKKSVVPRGLFDDLDDEDTDDLFSSAPKQNSGQQLPKEKPKDNKPMPVKSKGLFDDDTEHDDLFGPTPGHLILKPEDRPQQKSVPQEPVKDYKAVASKYKSRGLFDDDSEEEDLFKPKPSQQVEKKEKNVLSMATETNVGPASKASLFSDKEEEDLFASNPNQTKATLSTTSKAPKKASLFDDSGDDDDLFGPKTSTTNESNLIEEKNRLEAETKRQKAQEEALKLEEEKRKAAEEQATLVKIKEEQEEIKRVHMENERKRLDEEKEKLRLEAEEQKRLQEVEDNKQKEFEREQKRMKEEELQQLEQEKIKKDAEEQKQKKLAEEEKLRNLAAEEEERNRKEKERIIMEKEAELAQTRAQEASKKSTLFDDLDDEEDFFEEIVQKPSQEAFSTSVSIFDEPPEDNHYNPTTVSVAKIPNFEDGESSEDDSLFAGKKRNPILQASTAKKSIDLFSDLPPEDDQEDLFASMPKSIDSVTQKKDVFYDDMAESFPPQVVDKSIKQDNKSLSSSMLEVVVPEDDMDDVFAKESPVKSIKKSEIIQSVRDLIKSHENPVEQLPTEPSTRKSLPNKLNTNLVINVNAILPGARPPPMAKRMSLDSFEDIPKADTNEVSPDKALNSTSPSIGVSTPVDQNVNQNSATLSSLNKGRPKATSNRRPSTRKGRQESLRRSQLFDDSEGIPANDAIDQPSQVVEDIKPVPVQSTKNPIEVATPVIVKQEAPTKTRKLFDSDEDEDSDDLFKPKSVTPKAPEVHKKEVPKREVIKRDVPKPKQTSLFSDDGDSDGDLFSSSSSKGKTLLSIPIHQLLIIFFFSSVFCQVLNQQGCSEEGSFPNVYRS